MFFCITSYKRGLCLPLSLMIIVLSWASPALSEGTSSGDMKERSKAETVVRLGAAFAATSAIKGLFGMAPGYLMTFLPSMGASLFVPALIGAGILEGAISLTVFSAITGVKDRQWLVRSFLLASVVSVTATYFFTGLMAPWLVAVLSNTMRLVVFSMLTRPADTDVTDYIVDEVKDVVGIQDNDEEPAESPSDSPSGSLSVTQIEERRLTSYKMYMSSVDNSERTAAYNSFTYYSGLLSKARSVEVNSAQ